MKKLNIKTSINSYDIIIGQESILKLNSLTKNYDKILLLTNNTVGDIYKDKIFDLLPKDSTFLYQISDGEIFKNIDTAMDICSFLIEHNFSRNSLIVCLGGGVICDLGGFVASIFMRGINFLQIPTSLLAQVDASIGGKVAVNHPLGKNLIGAFKQPIAVIIDINFLKTLPDNEFKSGMGEVIKHALILKNSNFFEFLEKQYSGILNLEAHILIDMIFESCKIKKIFVEEDEFEKGNRAFLNLGHTYAHALETIFNYENISHGKAVAKGIIFELSLSKHLNFIDEEYIQKVKQLFNLYNIDCHPIYLEENTLIEVMKKDKKNVNNSINFILDKRDSLENTSISQKDILKVNSFFKDRFLKGIIDIGTNSCRLFIAEIEKKDSKLEIITPLFKDLDVSRLGKNLNQTGILSKESIEKTFSIIKTFKEKADSMGVSELIAFATSATREATNGEIFVRDIKTKFNINTLIIPGETEARLSFNGNRDIYREKIATIDVGGGSTEVTIGDFKNIEFIKSFPIGVVKLTEMFFSEENYSEESLKSSRNYLRGFFKELDRFKNSHFRIIGVAGTVTSNVSIIKKLPKFIEKEIHHYTLSKAILEENLTLFLSKNLEERKKIVGLEPNRADVIIAGNLILLTLLEVLEKNNITVSTNDNLEGAMVLNI